MIDRIDILMPMDDYLIDILRHYHAITPRHYAIYHYYDAFQRARRRRAAGHVTPRHIRHIIIDTISITPRHAMPRKY